MAKKKNHKRQKVTTPNLFLLPVLLIACIVLLFILNANNFGEKTITYATGTTQFGVQIDSHYADKIPALSHLQQLNPEWVRGDYTKTTFSPQWPSSVKSIVIVNNETGNIGGPASNASLSEWKKYVDTIYVPKIKQILQETPSIPAIEIWNEEDICVTGFCPYVPPAAYSYMLTQSTTAIKAINPNIKVIMGGMASHKIQYLRDVINANPTGFKKIDIVGLHPYETAPDGWCARGCTSNLTKGDLATEIRNYKNTSGKPVWVTEVGHNSKNRTWQAEYLRRSFQVMQRLQVPVVIWFAWSDIMVPDFGLMDVNKIIKPSGQEFRKFNTHPTPFFTPTPTPSDGYTGQYYDNPNLSSTPKITRVDAAINFDWGNGSPDPVIPVDNFSVRWTKIKNFPAGTYRFTVTADDGVRLYIDNNILIDKWIIQPPTTYTVDQTLAAGDHTIKVEYYENAIGAVMKFNYQEIVVTPTPTLTSNPTP